MVRENKEKLILEVRARPPLWKEEHVNFRKKAVTDKLWEEVAAACSLTNGVAAKAKWKSLKDQYRREMQKILQTGLESAFTKPKWQYFDVMAFTQDYVIANQIHGSLVTCEIQDSYEENNIASTSNENEYAETLTNGYVTDEEHCKRLIESTSVPYGMVSTAAVQTSRRSSIASTSSGSVSRKHKRKSNDSISQLMTLEKQKVNFLLNSMSNDNGHNSDLNFFKSLVPYMEHFTPLHNLKVRSKILELVIEQYKQIRKNPQTVISTIRQRSSSRVQNLNKNVSG